MLFKHWYSALQISAVPLAWTKGTFSSKRSNPLHYRTVPASSPEKGTERWNDGTSETQCPQQASGVKSVCNCLMKHHKHQDNQLLYCKIQRNFILMLLLMSSVELYRGSIITSYKKTKLSARNHCWNGKFKRGWQNCVNLMWNPKSA